MTDATIKVGDVVHDLVKRGKMQVLAKAADSVAAYRDQENYDLAAYKSHPLLDVSDGEPVFTCVYLPDDPTTSFSGTYDFPQSRLARVPVEEANQDYGRVQEELIVTVLSTLMETALTADGADNGRPDSFEQAIRFCWPEQYRDLLDDAVEVAETTHLLKEADDE